MLQRFFARFTSAVARITESPFAFGVAVLAVLVWLGSGPLLQYSEVWRDTIDVGLSIVTFLIALIIHSSQDRDSHAIQTKLDELIRVTKEADDTLLDLEKLSEPEIERIRERYASLARRARQAGGGIATSPVEGGRDREAKSGD